MINTEHITEVLKGETFKIAGERYAIIDGLLQSKNVLGFKNLTRLGDKQYYAIGKNRFVPYVYCDDDKETFSVYE